MAAAKRKPKSKIKVGQKRIRRNGKTSVVLAKGWKYENGKPKKVKR